MVNSRQKGAAGEREIAKILRTYYGYKEARRGQQFCGKNGDADVVALPRVHMEVKRVERLNIYDAIDQSKRDARQGEFPAVFHRKNRCEWLVTVQLDTFMQLYNEWLAGQELEEKEAEENNGEH